MEPNLSLSRSGVALNDFANPFATYSNKIYPRTIREVFEWAEWLWLRHGVYSQAIQRSIRYFLNGIELSGEDVSKDTRKEYEERLLDDFNILDILGIIGDDYLGFGNSFTSVSLPISRSLICSTPGCGLSRALDKMIKGQDYGWNNFKFTGTCPQCKRSVTFLRSDSREANEQQGQLIIIRWPPQDVAIDHNRITNESDYYYRIPNDVATKIKRGDPLTLQTLPWEFIEAVEKDKPLKFNNNTFIHLKNETSASMLARLDGWGLPKFMSNFSQVVQLQVLDRFNEAIAHDYIVPTRLMTPETTAGGMDPLQTFGMNNFMGAVRRMIQEHRKDPTSWHTLPAPVKYHVIGGEAKNLVPVELMDRGMDNLLTSMGIATDFYRGSLTVGGPPIGLRMFEKTWIHHTTNLTKWLNWFLAKCQEFLMWKEMRGQLIMTSVVEDDVTKQVKLNLAASRVISNATALRAFKIDPDYEKERMLEEERDMADQAREEGARENKAQMLDEYVQQGVPGMIPPNAAQANMGLPEGQAAPPMAGGVMPMAPPGAAPMGMAPGSGGPPTLDDMMGEAQMMAQQLLTMPPNIRRNELTNMKKTNPTMHALVKQELDNLEQGIQSTALQQAKSGGGQPSMM